VEKYKGKDIFKFTGATMLGCLALTSCGSNYDSPPVIDQTNLSVDNVDDFKVERFFTPSGKMKSYVSQSDQWASDFTLSYCQGDDLIDVSGIPDRSADSFLRSPNHSACDDGRLTPEDFNN